MAKKISEIYTKYKIMPNLQEHMFRVAAVASLVCDNFSDPIPKEEIMTACLLHDMGNIIKFDLSQTKDFLNKNIDLDYWEKVRAEFRERYGENEHQATLQIIKELGVSKKVSDLVAIVDFSEIFNIFDKSIEKQITLYTDCRVDPFGVVSVEERLLEGRNRYKKRKNQATDEHWELAKSIFLKLENNIFSKCRIKPADINNKTTAPIILALKDFVIHSTKTQDHGD